jgi:hypothetical protein
MTLRGIAAADGIANAHHVKVATRVGWHFRTHFAVRKFAHMNECCLIKREGIVQAKKLLSRLVKLWFTCVAQVLQPSVKQQIANWLQKERSSEDTWSSTFMRFFDSIFVLPKNRFQLSTKINFW